MSINIDLIKHNINQFLTDEYEKQSNMISTTCFFSFSVENEIKIADIIKNIPSILEKKYDIIEDYDFINIGQLHDNLIQTHSNIDKKYVICKYIEQNSIKFSDFLFNLPSPKLLIFHILDSYSYLLNSLHTLNQSNICFFDLSPENISFNKNYKPILQNFKTSIVIDSLNEEYISNIIKNTRDYTHKPFEIHVLFYLTKNNFSVLNEKLIQQICDKYIETLTILQLFSQEYRDHHKIDCYNFLNSYINKPTSDVILDLLKYNDKWDTYSISLLYLHIIAHLTRVFGLKGTIMSKMIALLTKNINPNPNSRETLQDTLVIYNKLFDIYKDWSFVDKITNEKMDIFFVSLRNY